MWPRVLELWQPIARQPAEKQAIEAIAAALRSGRTEHLLAQLGNAIDWLLVNRKLTAAGAIDLQPLVQQLCSGNPGALLGRMLRSGFASSVLECGAGWVSVPEVVHKRCDDLLGSMPGTPDGWWCGAAWPATIARMRCTLPRDELIVVHDIAAEAGPLNSGLRCPGPALPLEQFAAMRASMPHDYDLNTALRLGTSDAMRAMALSCGLESQPMHALLQVLGHCAWKSRLADLAQYGSWNGFVAEGHFMSQFFRHDQPGPPCVLVKVGWLAVALCALGADPGRIPIDESCIFPCEMSLMASGGIEHGVATFRGTPYPAYRIPLADVPNWVWLDERAVIGGLIAATWQKAAA